MKKVVVVLPTYNEKGSIAKMIEQVLAQEGKVGGFEIEVLISDSRSPDGTGKVVQELGKKNPKVHYLDVVQRGIGVGLIKGHEYAIKKLGAQVLIQMDADGQHDPNDIPRFLKEIEKGHDFVFGSRLIPGGENQIDWYRRIFTLGSSIACRLLTGLMNVYDFTPSFRAFTKEAFLEVDKNKIPWESKTFIIQPSFLYEAIAAGAKYKELPIVFTSRRAGYSKNQIVAYALDIFRFGFRVRLEKSQTFLRFCVVGTIGFVVNALGLEVFYRLGLRPSLAAALGAELAIVSNFLLNNVWTFAGYKIREWGRILVKFLQFNLTSFGAIIIQFIVVGLGTSFFGDQTRQLFLVLAVVFLVIPYNYFMYSRVIWRAKR